MRSAIEGTWKVTVHATATTPAHDIVLSISQSAAPRPQHSQRRGLVSDAAACQTRSLVRSAGACADISEMPLDVTLLAGGAARKGMFMVPGLTFQFGLLEATLGAVTVMAKVSPSGAIISVDLGGTEAGASMVRMSQP